ncbi:MAG: shikimate dehydrogenase, partial [bacterium]
LEENELKKFFIRMRTGEIAGVNVTIPYKQKVIPFLDKLNPHAEACGAVNTIIVEKGKLIGDNTDGRGFINALTEETAIVLMNTKVVVIGAGGASRAVCTSLCEQGVNSLTIINRSLDKAKEFANKLKQLFPQIDFQTQPLKNLAISNFINTTLLVNTTSLGMTYDWEDLGFIEKLNKEAIVSDIISRPAKSPLIKKAEEQGLKVNHGYNMLLHQAYIGFELLTHEKAPRAIMKQAVLKALGV